MQQKNHPFLIVAATAAVASLLSFANPARAQMPSNSGARMTGDSFSGGPAIKGDAAYVRRFVFFNLDAASVNRYKAMGFTDYEIKGAGNLALQTGLPIDFFFGRLKIGGKSLPDLAVQYSTPKNNLAYHLSDPIPGYGMNAMMPMR